MTTQVASTSESVDASQTAGSSIRAIKRKLDDAFSILDDAVMPPEKLEGPPPTKKSFASRSFYSTLAKYGIKSKPKEAPISDSSESLPGLSKPTPHLTAILNRAASRTRKVLPSFRLPLSTFASATAPISSLHTGAQYRPSSTSSFLSRLSTFKMTTYANKPTAIDAVAAAKCGWMNDGKDRLVCGMCGASWVVVGREGMSRDAANTLVEKQRQSLVQSHKDGCPWKTRQCEDSVYRIQLKPPPTMAQELKSTALGLQPILEGVEVKHPLTSPQVSSLRSALSSVTLMPSPSDINLRLADSTEASESPLSPEPTETALLTALFGWTIAPPATVDHTYHHGSVSRITSRLPSRSSTPSLSRAGSVPPSRPGISSIPQSISAACISMAPSRSISTAGIAPSSRRVSRTSTTSTSDKLNKRDTALLYCALCQRRIGLWAFAPAVSVPTDSASSTQVNGDIPSAEAQSPSDPASTQIRPPTPPPPKSSPRRQFDLLKEHRSYCPYVVKSTIVPALPVPPPSNGASQSSDSSRFNFSLYSLSSQALTAAGVNNAMEGWRAVFTIVLRYGLSQRQRRLPRSATIDTTGSANAVDAEAMEVDGVEAMVEGVKRRGGRDLLRYVKGLLG